MQTGALREIPFEAFVERELDATIRFAQELPTEGAQLTRSHRFGRLTAAGIVHEALGDLWLLDEAGNNRRLTESDDHETAPVALPAGLLAWAVWNDDELGGVSVGALGHDGVQAVVELPGRPSQYGALAASRAPDGGTWLFAVRGADDLLRGTHIERQTALELVWWDLGREPFAGSVAEPVVVTELRWVGNRYAHRPPTILPEPERGSLLFTEFDAGASAG